METKKCGKCQIIKEFSEFYKDRSKKGGISGWCKSCQKEYEQGEAGKRNREKYVASGKHGENAKRYWQSDKCRETKRAYRASQSGREIIVKSEIKYAKSEHGKKKKCEKAARYRNRYPEKIKAHNRIGKAVFMGKIPPADELQCVKCGKQAKEYHHYLGYEPEHWLDVIPLCKTCHHETT